MPVGAFVPVAAVYRLSRDWYRGRLDLDWQRPDAARSTAILEEHGLTGTFWSLV